MRILLFGMRCHFTPPVLAALLDAGHDVTGVVLPGRQPGRAWRWLRKPGSRPGVPLAGVPTIESLAARHRLPLAEWNSGDIESALEAIPALQPDLIVVACFPRLIPNVVVDLAPFGGCNVHPSLLPALRGPDPLFWTLHAGLHRSGVTVHLLSDRFDAGDIVAQREIEIPAGERIDRLETVMGQVGGELLGETLPQWAMARTSARPQNHGAATSAPNPQPSDLRVPVTWPVERAFRFIRGIAPLRMETEIFDGNGKIWRVRDAECWDAESVEAESMQGYREKIAIPFSDGFLRVIPTEIEH